MKSRVKNIALAMALLMPGLHAQAADVETADRVFIGKHIITMDPNKPKAEAVAISGDKIVYVGDKKHAKKMIGKTTEVVELGNSALVPGMIDAHGHFSMVAFTSDFVNASSPPVGKMESIDDIIADVSQALEQA